ncbi:hypothetical protein AB0L06_30105 [Spirillospora sp. NPDC052269]
MSNSMYGPASRPDDPAASQPRPNPGRLWAGGLATAVVAALVVVVGVLLVVGVAIVSLLCAVANTAMQRPADARPPAPPPPGYHG